MFKFSLVLIGVAISICACTVKPIEQLNQDLFDVKKQLAAPIDEAIIDSLLKRHKVDGISLAYLNYEGIIWSKGYGYKDSKHKLKVDENTSFQAAEISHTVAIYSLFILINNSKIYLDTDLREYLKEFEIPNNYPDQFLALRNLLKHRGGINISKFEPYKIGDSLPNLDQIIRGISPAKNEAIKVAYEPLKTLEYSEGIYAVVQKIIEKKMREPYSTFANAYVLSHLKMENSSFLYPIDSQNTSNGFLSYKKPIDGGYNLYPQIASSGLWTTAGDLVRFMNGVIWAAIGKSATISRENIEDMIYNQMGITYNSLNKTLSYKGQNEGFSSQFIGSIETNNGIAIMANSPNAEALFNDIYRYIN